MIGVLRLRGNIKVKRKIRDTLKILGLNKINSLKFIPDSQVNMAGLVKNYVTYGEVSKDFSKELEGKVRKDNKNVFHLPPSRGCLKSVKELYPKGATGKRDDFEDFLRSWLNEEKKEKK